MIQAEIKVNGALIGLLTVVNIFLSKPSDLCKYYVEYYEPDSDGSIIRTAVEHIRSDGAERLMEIAFGKVVEERAKEANSG